MRTSDFDYELPAELIAQRPLVARTDSRLLCLPADSSRGWVDSQFSELTEWLQPGDVLVFNNTKVFPARLYGQKSTGGQIEILIERLLGGSQVLAHVRASKSPKPGGELQLQDGTAVVVIDRQGELFQLDFKIGGELLAYLEQAGSLPLPPYIERTPEQQDLERYQTVFAEHIGAVAAPTAGLHFDQSILKRLQEQGVESAFITLHVGAGTFQPVRSDVIKDHSMHAEQAEVPEAVCEQVRQAKARGSRVVAVGTTVVRSLEAAAIGGKLQAFMGDTNLFITPGYSFQVVDALITNFHLPRSSLLMLVSAFAGHARVMRAYRHAVHQGYRFFSYGDAMFIERGDAG